MISGPSHGQRSSKRFERFVLEVLEHASSGAPKSSCWCIKSTCRGCQYCLRPKLTFSTQLTSCSATFALKTSCRPITLSGYRPPRDQATPSAASDNLCVVSPARVTARVVAQPHKGTHPGFDLAPSERRSCLGADTPNVARRGTSPTVNRWWKNSVPPPDITRLQMSPIAPTWLTGRLQIILRSARCCVRQRSHCTHWTCGG